MPDVLLPMDPKTKLFYVLNGGEVIEQSRLFGMIKLIRNVAIIGVPAAVCSIVTCGGLVFLLR